MSFQQLSLFHVAQLDGQFDLINCVGVLHHTSDPIGGIQALAEKVAPGGLLHIFVYGELGRWEIKLMQEAIALLQGDKRGDYTDGVQVGRKIFASLPDGNALLRREKERWALENQRDECFADMYVHPQEIDYNVNTVFELIEASGLEFLGFSNPQVWTLQRLLSNAPELIERASHLSELDTYRLIELLDPGAISHYEFFLAKPPFVQETWQEDAKLLNATAELNPCNSGWPSKSFFNFDYQLASVNDAEFEFMQACEASPDATIEQLLSQVDATLSDVRSLIKQHFIIIKRNLP